MLPSSLLLFFPLFCFSFLSSIISSILPSFPPPFSFPSPLFLSLFFPCGIPFPSLSQCSCCSRSLYWVMEDGRWCSLINSDGSQWWAGLSENTSQWNGSTAIFISNAVTPNMIVMICFFLSASLSNISLPLCLIYSCTHNLTLSKSSDHSGHYDSLWRSVCHIHINTI